MLAALLANAALTSAPSDGAAPSIARPVYAYVVTPSRKAKPRSGEPRILRVQLNKQRFSSRDEIDMEVLTSPNVVRVVTRELNHGGTLHKAAPGVFRAHGPLTGLPSFVHGMHVTLHFTATTAGGDATSVNAPVTF